MSCSSGGGFGSGGFGSMPFGSGSTLAIVSAVAVGLNLIRVAFEGIPEASDPATAWDALNPDRWTLIVLDPPDATPRLVQTIDRGPTVYEIDVYVDGPLQSGASYVISVSELLRDDTGVTVVADPDCRMATFLALEIPATPQAITSTGQQTHATDIANPQLEQDVLVPGGALGSFQVTDTGDYALESGRPYLRKRIIRRLTTVRGGFFHLPNYGVGQKPKTVIRDSVMARMASDAEGQIALEPDVSRVRVRASQPRPGIVVLTASVVDQFGEVETVAQRFDLTS